jgi:hypothetical protein
VPGRSMVAFLSLLLAIGVGSARAQRSDSLPTAVATAFRQAYPAATILHKSRERQDGQVVYEVESQDGPTRRDLLYGVDGHTIEIEEVIPSDSLPAPVRTAVGRDAPGAAVVEVERVSREALVSYEVHVRQNGHTHGLTYDAEGRRQ